MLSLALWRRVTESDRIVLSGQIHIRIEGQGEETVA
jgi:hypothetical protein